MYNVLGEEDKPSIVDLIRSMRSYGFSQGEIHDVVTGAGAPGEEVQILIDRIESDFESANFERKNSRITEEIKKIFEEKLEEFEIDMRATLRGFDRDLRDLRREQCILEDFLLDMRKICSKECESWSD